MNTSHPKIISRVRILALVATVFVIFMFVMILRDTGLFSYRPSAEEVDGFVHSEIINRESINSVVVSRSDLPDCIDEFTYIPESGHDESSCFAQFICGDKTKDGNRNSCVVTQGEGECTLDMSIDTCQPISEWINDVSSLCGCSLL